MITEHHLCIIKHKFELVCFENINIKTPGTTVSIFKT